MSVGMTIIDSGGPGYLNVLVMLFAWNALKFALMGVVSLPMLLWRSVASGRTSFGAQTVGRGGRSVQPCRD
jgi:hypothetical protein